MKQLRGDSVWILVHDGPMTISEVARLCGVSVQMARRLYLASALADSERSSTANRSDERPSPLT
jgi:hypothetical protein